MIYLGQLLIAHGKVFSNEAMRYLKHHPMTQAKYTHTNPDAKQHATPTPFNAWSIFFQLLGADFCIDWPMASSIMNNGNPSITIIMV